MSKENENFEFSGFLENNESFEVPDKTEKKKPKNNGMNFGSMGPPNLTPEDIKNLFGGTYPIHGEIADMGNMGELSNMINSIMGGLMNFLGEDEFGDIRDEDEQKVLDDEDPYIYELGKVDSYLDTKTFGSVECLENEDLYKDFKSKTKRKSVEEILNGKKGSNITNIENSLVKRLPFEKIESLELIEIMNTSSVLLYAKPEDPSLTGFFVVLYQDENKDFKFLVPVYGNTFKYDKINDEIDLYTISESRRLFKDDIPNGQTNFKFMILPALKFFTNFTLTVKNKNKYAITAAEVGSYKNVMPAIRDATDNLKVANITFNDSSKAEMIKGFAGLKSEGPYPFYFKFTEMVDKEDLILLSELLFKVDLNNCALMKNKEINSGFDDNGKVYFYITVDQIDLY